MDKLAIGICSGSIGSFIFTLCARIDTLLWQLSLVRACVVTRSLSVLPRQLDIAELHPPSATASAECGIPHISGVHVLFTTRRAHRACARRTKYDSIGACLITNSATKVGS